MDGDAGDVSGRESATDRLAERKEILSVQLSEFEMLQSMFSNPGELHLQDPSVLAHFRNYIEGRTLLPPKRLDFAIRVTIDCRKLEACVNLPPEYPSIEPEVFVRSDDLDRTRQHLLNNDLGNYISDLSRGDICIGSVVAWLQENAATYFREAETEARNECTSNPSFDENAIFTRFWIYSHHIYNKDKRRDILHLAHEHNLTGFCLPGRPGIICVEGLSFDCEEWWSKIKSMKWKKITCKKKEETGTEKVKVDSLRKFPDFREIWFENKGKNKDSHMDFGQFHKYLQDHSCEYIFKDYFGVDGK